ncbi:hypothetical protein SASPL_133834 [Salvia splendens]|uniref:Uncharacterized protein n=1 Tax=Salvia splendens TaxID=180675 RepID=A0A8X8X5S9_SALSN|nr:hypothetical protein SASPL_133834 [Salvia splendens]
MMWSYESNYAYVYSDTMQSCPSQTGAKMKEAIYKLHCPIPFLKIKANVLFPFVGPGGDFCVYLEGLAEAENVQEYVKANPFGQSPITEKDQYWSFYSKIITANSTLPREKDTGIGDDIQPHTRDLNDLDLSTLVRRSNDIGIVIEDTPNPDGIPDSDGENDVGNDGWIPEADGENYAGIDEDHEKEAFQEQEIGYEQCVQVKVVLHEQL